MKRRKRQIGLKINIRQQTNPKNQTQTKTLEKLKSFMVVVHFQHPSRTLALPPPVHGHPQPGSNPKRVCLVEIGLHGENQAQVSSYRGRAHLTASGGCEDPRGGDPASIRGTQSCCPPCQQQAEQTGSILVYASSNARSFLLAALPSV